MKDVEVSTYEHQKHNINTSNIKIVGSELSQKNAVKKARYWFEIDSSPLSLLTPPPPYC